MLETRLCERLTQREKDVLHCLSEGLSNGQIAAKLSVTVKTVEFHLTHVYKKIGVRNRSEALLVLFANQE